MKHSLISIALVIAFFSADFKARGDEKRDKFDAQFRQAQALFKEDKLREAYAAVQAAARLDPSRYEASGLAALVLLKDGKVTASREALAEARKLSPPDATKKLDDIANLIETAGKVAAQNAGQIGQDKADGSRKNYEYLRLIVEDADKATSPEQRKKLLREFMAKSAEFIVDNPTQTNVWILRAAAAMELDYLGSGWLAGRRLKQLGGETSADPKMAKVMAMLERKGWLGNERKWRDWSKFTTEQALRIANEGDAEAQNAFGDWCFDGRNGQTKDQAKAVEWYRRAAEQGDAMALYTLATKYENGLGVAKDVAGAINWYRKAAGQGDVRAQSGLGHIYMYRDGDGVTRNPAEGLRWLRLATAQGDARSANAIGWIYKLGRGVAKDEVESVRWFRLAAEQGDASAQQTLGLIYWRGEGVAKDEVESMRWRRKAAESGNRFAMDGLAWRLATAPKAELRNGKEAVMWASKACAGTQSTNASYSQFMDTLATSYAEAGDFLNAVKYARIALESADPNNSRNIQEKQNRLKLFEAGQTFRVD